MGKQIVERTWKLESGDFKEWVSLSVQQSYIMLPKKEFMSINAAEEKVIIVKNQLEQMRRDNAPGSEIRTVECDWFGAEENKQLAEMAKNGRLKQVYQSVLPAEINIISIDNKQFVFLPGEMFVEYSLIIKENSPGNTFITSLSNGVLAGYIVTEAAEQEGGYEASNSIFPASAGQVLMNQVIDMLEKQNQKGKSKKEGV